MDTIAIKKQNQIRISSVELLKIIAIILIILSHIVQTFSPDNIFTPYKDFMMDLSYATTNTQFFILSLFRTFGALGNTIFFVCSAWFLLENDTMKPKKIFRLIFEIWVVSVIILLITLCNQSIPIDTKNIIRSFVPTISNNNWYLTCYILFYAVHPFLNQIIKTMKQPQLLRTTITLSILYIGFNFLKPDLFFTSYLILWCTIYFIIAYVKIYLRDFSEHKKNSYLFLGIGILGHILLMMIINFLGLKISFFHDKLLYFGSSSSPFFLIIAISSLQLALQRKTYHKSINYIASLSILIYIIHENIILRTYYRPYILNAIYQQDGYNNILLWVILLAFVISIFSFILSVIFQYIFDKKLFHLCDKLYDLFTKRYQKIEANLLKIK